jgi:hypothetical protein
MAHADVMNDGIEAAQCVGLPRNRVHARKPRHAADDYRRGNGGGALRVTGALRIARVQGDGAPLRQQLPRSQEPQAVGLAVTKTRAVRRTINLDGRAVSA